MAVVAGVAQSMVLVTYITLRTAYSPDALLGRIGSTARTISLGLQPIGLLVGGALIDATSGSTTIAAIGVGLLLVSLVFVPIRALADRDASSPRSEGQAASATGTVDRIRRQLDDDRAGRAGERLARVASRDIGATMWPVAPGAVECRCSVFMPEPMPSAA